MATANAKLGSDIKSAKIHIRVCRSQVTKAIKQFESSGAELQKNEQGSKAKKLRLAAGMLESLEILQTKVKKMEQANDNIIEANRLPKYSTTRTTGCVVPYQGMHALDVVHCAGAERSPQ